MVVEKRKISIRTVVMFESRGQAMTWERMGNVNVDLGMLNSDRDYRGFGGWFGFGTPVVS